MARCLGLEPLKDVNLHEDSEQVKNIVDEDFANGSDVNGVHHREVVRLDIVHLLVLSLDLFSVLPYTSALVHRGVESAVLVPVNEHQVYDSEQNTLAHGLQPADPHSVIVNVEVNVAVHLKVAEDHAQGLKVVFEL